MGALRFCQCCANFSLMFWVTKGDNKPLRSRMVFSRSIITWHDATSFSFPFILPRGNISDLFYEWLIYCWSCKTLIQLQSLTSLKMPRTKICFLILETISVWSEHQCLFHRPGIVRMVIMCDGVLHHSEVNIFSAWSSRRWKICFCNTA